MRIPYSQGVYKGAVSGQDLIYLEIEGGGEAINIHAAETSLVAVICHRDRNYLIEERGHVDLAWIGLVDNIDYWLYWDVNIVTGRVTRGWTVLEPVVANVAPGQGLQVEDQHWFDTVTKTTFVWTKVSTGPDVFEWKEKIRVFAGRYDNGTTIVPYPFETQGDQNDEVEAGYILYNAGGNAIKDQTTRFVTTSSPLSVKLASMGDVPDAEFPVNLDAAIQYAVASESIPAFSMVSPSTVNHIQLADFTLGQFAIGMTVHDMSIDEDARIYSNGFIQNGDWNFAEVDFGKTLYLGDAGAVTLTRPAGNPQIVGQVVWTDTIQLGIKTDATIVGPTGPSGTAGAASTVTGPTGWTGPSVTGPTGADSSVTGPTGSTGTSGFSGYSGTNGASGTSGFSGAVGPTGAQGTAGAASTVAGPTGPSVTGPTGSQGIKGPTGMTGATGPQGQQGVIGNSGFSGYSGLSGFSGGVGAGGATGPTGATGDAGLQGTSGFSGYSGFSGASGFSGYSSSSGFSGYSSSSVFSGYSAISGFSGTSGFSGANPGASGFSGYSAVSGFSGYSAATGTSGFSGYSGIGTPAVVGQISATVGGLTAGSATGEISIVTNATPYRILYWNGSNWIDPATGITAV
jgi:hypothetical protein